MATNDRVRMIIELEPCADPIRGTLVDASGAERDFSGWMQLSTALAEASDRLPRDALPDRRKA